MSTPQNKAPQPVASLDRQRRPHSAQRPQISVRLPARLCSHLEAGLGEHPEVSSSSRLLQDSCPAATGRLLAFTGGLRLGGSPPHPPADLCLLVSRGNTDLCRFSWLEAGPLFAQPRGGEAPEGGRQGSFGGHPGVWSDCDWVPPPPGQTPFSRPSCISACFRILAPVLSLTAGLQRGPQAACPLCPQGPTRLAAPPFAAGRPPPQGKAPCAPPPPWLS